LKRILLLIIVKDTIQIETITGEDKEVVRMIDILGDEMIQVLMMIDMVIEKGVVKL
jgi:hypothetical protein